MLTLTFSFSAQFMSLGIRIQILSTVHTFMTTCVYSSIDRNKCVFSGSYFPSLPLSTTLFTQQTKV